MTTIAWDGRTLAADKRATLGGVRMTVTKIGRGRNGNLVGVSGTCALTESIFEWLCKGGKKPDGMSDAKDWAPTIEITPKGECFRHERWGKFRVENPFYAIGSGADFALAAMRLGKSAREAVELAAEFDTATGDGVDALPLKEKATGRAATKILAPPMKKAAARSLRGLNWDA